MSLYTRLSKLFSRSFVQNPPSNYSSVWFTTKPWLVQLQVPRRHLNYIKDKPFIGRKSLENLQRKDGIPKSFTLVYRTNFPNYFLSAQVFVFLSIGAFAVVGITAYVESLMPEEEKRQALEKIKEERIEKEKQAAIARQKSIDFVLKTEPVPVDTMPKPQLSDLVDQDLETVLLVVCSLVVLAVSLYRIMRLMPVRIYVGKKKHCVGIYNGSLIPGRTTHQEFVAGTLKPRKTFGPGIWGDSLFRDGSGHDLILLEQFFRHPADFNYLLGLQKDDEYEPEDEMSQFKESGAFASDDYTRSENKGTTPVNKKREL